VRTTSGGAVEPLDNPVRPYAWGSSTAIPALLGVPATGAPQAELWLGAHPAAPSRLVSGGTLLSRIAADPAGELGPELVERFGPELPFLLKVIAAAEPLSLQAHPALARARAGFAAEEARGVPRDAPGRNYRDPNHKPELVCAVTPFAALAGFRSVPATIGLLAPLVAAVPPLAPYAEMLGSAPLPDVVAALLTDASADLVAAVATACAGLDDPAYRTAAELARLHPGDPGVLITLLLNRVDLAPGEALFLAAGNLHCYLHGTAVEVLANSDNVLRGGLTGKHVDVPELLAVLDPAAGPPPRLAPTRSGPVESYRPPVPDFRLDRVTLSATPVPLAGPSLVLVLAGAALAGGEPLERGASGWIPYGRTVAVTGDGVLVRATAGTG
jgi:mannose-6-phosphate isomerase